MKATTQRTGSPCACFCCGIEVYPYPLDIDPELHIVRGYPTVATVVDGHTRRLSLQPRLLCPTCAGPSIIEDCSATGASTRRSLANEPQV